MSFIPVFIAAIAPGLALLVYFYLKDRYVTEPIRMVSTMFLVGILAVIPIMVIQRGLYLWLGSNKLVSAFVLSGGTEEFIKWFVLYYYIYKHKHFDEPYDGIVYAVSVSLGFATLENVIYAWSLPVTIASLLLRALLPVSAHALFAVMMGYYLGKARFPDDSRKPYLLWALFIPIFYHGLYDYLLLIAEEQMIIWGVVPLMVGLWLRGIWKVNRANDSSPYRAVLREDELKKPL